MLIGVLVSDASTAGGKLLTVVLVPLGALLYVIWSRVALEVVIALFRTMENPGEAARLLRDAAPAAPAGPPTGDLGGAA